MLIQANMRDGIPLRDASVDCVVTSPPYWGLRDYGVAGQIGLERTPEEYVATIVQVFREVWRVLKPSGTCWINLGDTYGGRGGNPEESGHRKQATNAGCLIKSFPVSNIANCFNRILKGCCVFGFNAISVAMPCKGINISLDDQRPPEGILSGLLRAQGESIKDRDNNFSEVFDFLAIPRQRRAAITECFVCRNESATDCLVQRIDSTGVVRSDLDSDLEAEFVVLGTPGTSARHNYDTSLTIKKTGEPRAKGAVCWHSDWDSFAQAASRKGVPDIDLMNNSIYFRDGHLSLACLFCDFRIAQASAEKITFKSIKSDFLFTVSDVRHLWFSFTDGSLIPYSTLYDKSIRLFNRERPKQEIGIPNRVKIALQEDGWICRQTIIWHKLNPMPESVTDRCTKAHEYVFLLTKSAQYYYDADAIRESAEYGRCGWDSQQFKGGDLTRHHGGRGSCRNGCDPSAGRNRRSVWTVVSQAYPNAHFATFPEKLIEPMILAGCPERCCVECGKPWVRQTETITPPLRKTNTAGPHGEHGLLGGHRFDEPVQTRTLGVIPTCKCDAEMAPGVVLDPFVGSGTTCAVAERLGRRGVGCELNAKYLELAKRRTRQQYLELA